MQVKYDLVVDFAHPSKSNTVIISEGDSNSRVLHFTLLNNKSPMSMSDVTLVTVRAIKGNEDAIFAEATILTNEDDEYINEVEYALPSTMTDYAGNVTLTLTLMSETNQILTSFEMYVKVRNALYNEDDYVSEEDMSGFRDLLTRTEAAVQRVESMIQEDSLPNPYPLNMTIEGEEHSYTGSDTVEIEIGNMAYVADSYEETDATDESAAASASASAAAAALSEYNASQSAIAASTKAGEASTSADDALSAKNSAVGAEGLARGYRDQCESFYNNMVQHAVADSLTTTSPITDSTEGNINAIKLVGNSYKDGNTIIQPSGDVVSHTKNLFDKSRVVENSKYLADGTYVADNNWVRELLKVKPNTSYTITSSMASSYFCEFDSNGTFIKYYAKKSQTITTSSNCAYIGVGVVKNSTLANYDLDTFQLEEGSVATTYEVGHYSSSHTDRPLLSIGNIKNELIINADGSGKFVERVKEVDLGSLVIARNTSYANPFFAIDSNSSGNEALRSMIKQGQILAEKYTVTNELYNTISNMSITSNSLGLASTRPFIMIRDDSYTDASAFKTSLNGVKLIYELATPTTTDLSVSEVAEMLSLKTYSGQTYIDTDGAEFEVSYFVDSNIAKAIADNKGYITEVAESVDEVNDTLNTLLPTRYISSGLTYTNCSYVGGGYCQIGKLVVANIRVTSSGTSFTIDGFPAYSNVVLASIVPLTVYDANSKTNVSGFVDYVNGKFTVSSATSGHIYFISAIYLCN